MSDLDICYLPATEAIRRFRARELSPVELVESVIARAEEVEPTVNAVYVRFFDEALEQAREAERRYAGSAPEPRALEGLPVAIKDEVTAIAWLRQKLESRPALIGELKPLWMRATSLLPAATSQCLLLRQTHLRRQDQLSPQNALLRFLRCSISIII